MTTTRHITDVDRQTLGEALNAEEAVLVKFWAPWCGPCKALGPTVEEIAGELAGQVRVVAVNVDENPDLASDYAVQGVPTLLLIKDGQIVERLTGNQPKAKIEDALKPHIA